jgi:hypothetical protein
MQHRRCDTLPSFPPKQSPNLAHHTQQTTSQRRPPLHLPLPSIPLLVLALRLRVQLAIMLIMMSMLLVLVLVLAVRIRMCIVCVRAVVRVVALLRRGARVNGGTLRRVRDGWRVGCRGHGGGVLVLVGLRVWLSDGDCGRGRGLEVGGALAVVG